MHDAMILFRFKFLIWLKRAMQKADETAFASLRCFSALALTEFISWNYLLKPVDIADRQDEWPDVGLALENMLKAIINHVRRNTKLIGN